MTAQTALSVPTWPQVVAIVREDGGGEVTIDGARHTVSAVDVAAARVEVLAHVRQQVAGQLDRPVRIDTFDPQGQWQLIVHPDGQVEAAEDGAGATTPQRAGRPAEARALRVLALAQPGRGPGLPDRAPAPAGAPTAGQEAPHDREGAVTAGRGRPHQAEAARADAPGLAHAPATVPTLGDLLAARPQPRATPAQWGWQGAVRRLSGDLARPGPGPAERAHRSAVAMVQRRLIGPRTVVVVNPKGGAHKTTAALLLAANFGMRRGGYALAWDNNETRGTMGWRAHPAEHTHTALDLLHALPRFAGSSPVRVGDLDEYVRAQDWGHFDVLASDEDAVSAGLIDAEAFGQLHTSLARFYRVMVVDTGNNMRAGNWQAAVEAADQLVIVSTIREDTAQSAAWLADALRATGKADLVRQAVTVLTAPARARDSGLGQRLHEHFSRLTRSVISVPHDPALVAGGPIDYDALTPASREAWLRASAAVADGL